jgi:putative ABC transport system substrate-binding protein
VDIMLAAGNEPALGAARAAAGATPIVFIALDFDPVEKGYVASLSLKLQATEVQMRHERAL